uniref:PRA1 family protein n=1 Tax=Timema tahoe TaxID=61484 RepID=A0A7R9P152_9NEOP|nr:unnamed protein product [Timema tahoe]
MWTRAQTKPTEQPLLMTLKGWELPKQLSLSSLAAKEWIGQRRETIRPWALFINTAHLRAPSSLPRLSKRVVKNIEYFHSNYFFVFLGLIAYCLITSPLLLIAVAASLGACYILSLKNSERKISFMGHELTLVQQYGLIAVCSFPIFYLAGAGAALFWVLEDAASIVIAQEGFSEDDIEQKIQYIHNRFSELPKIITQLKA